MADCHVCKHREDSTIFVYGYGEVPDIRCKKGGGKSERAINARKKNGKRKAGGECDHFKTKELTRMEVFDGHI